MGEQQSPHCDMEAEGAPGAEQAGSQAGDGDGVGGAVREDPQ